LLEIVHELALSPGKQITQRHIEAAARSWLRHRSEAGRADGWQYPGRGFVRLAERWVRFLGRLQEAEKKAPPFAGLVTDFAAYMQNERNLSPSTIESRCRFAEAFLRWLRARGRSLSEVSIEDVDSFQISKGKRVWSRGTMGTSAQALRAFFRHAEMRGWCQAGIAAAIDRPRFYRYEVLPSGPAWDDVRGLIERINTDQPRDIRDRAVLLLFSVYSFRAAEVSGLRLDDLDWEQEIISVARPKQRRPQQYPLVREVGDALLRYIRKVRPRCEHRQLFLTLPAPFRPLTRDALYAIVRRHFDRLGIPARHRGPHALRHACATRLMAQRVSLKQIGDHLGHTSLDSTRIYAKVDLNGLREVADFDLGGVI
jgi:site-specific recombinase XerD